MVATTALIEFWCSPHLSAANQHDLVGQPARLAILNKCRHSMVKAVPDSLHAVVHVQVVLVSMHVPHAGIARVDGHIAATGLAQPASLQ